MLRFFLLRFLPRRLLPVLLVVEAVRFIQGWRTRNRPPVAPPAGRRARVIEVREPNVQEHAWTDRAS